MEYFTNLIYSVGGGIKYGAEKIPIPSKETCKNVAYGSWELVKKTPIPSKETCKNAANGSLELIKKYPVTSAVVGGVAATTVAVPAVTSYVGFGVIGVKAGSWAALWQSSIGCVKAGSIFAWLQSFGATGCAVPATTKAIAGATSGAIVYLKDKKSN